MSRALLPEPAAIPDRAALEDLYSLPPRRHLRLNFVTSLDGAIEIDGTSEALGGPLDRDAFMAMRAVCDVIVAGAGTVRAENYGPARLKADAQARRAERGQEALPRLAVITASGDLDPAAKLFKDEGGEPVIVVTTSSAARAHPDLTSVSEVIECGELDVDLAQAVEILDRRGLCRILCEGGPRLSRQLIAAGLVDELCLTISPTLAGPGPRRLAELWPVGRPGRLALVSLLEGDGLLVARYRLPR
jgi:riboflavin biosynthesis pyrimidine reductase